MRCGSNTCLENINVSTPSAPDVNLNAFVRTILESYLGNSIGIDGVSNFQECDSESPVWLSFNYKGKDCSLALEDEWQSAVGLQSLLEWLHGSNQSELNGFEAVQLSQGRRESERLKISRVRYISKEKTCHALLSVEESFDPPRLNPGAKSAMTVSLPCFIELAQDSFCSPLILKACKLSIFPSLYASNLPAELSGVISATSRPQILSLEETVMNENPKIKTMIRLGALELGLDELMSLKSGSEISFTMPERTAVELELAGKVIAKAELRISGENYILAVTESYTSL
jgi:flagellar motor switch/type III secretory pathway protein FliN